MHHVIDTNSYNFAYLFLLKANLLDSWQKCII